MTSASSTAAHAAEPRLDVTRPILGAATSNELFARLLGLGRAPGATPYRVTRVLWMPPRFELSVALDGDGSVDVVLEGRATYHEANTAPPLLATAGLALWYRNGELPLPLQQRIARIAPRWGDLAVAGLLALLLRDGEAERFVPEWERADEEGRGDEVAPMEDPGLSIRSQMVGVWDEVSQFAEFFASDEFNAFPVESIEVASPFVRIEHADLECITLGSFDRPSAMTVVDYPWTDHLDPDDDLLARYMRQRMLLTEIDEDDVVMGCVGKLQGLLDRAPTKDDPTPVFVECSCLPATISEDVDGAIRRFVRSCPAQIAHSSRAHESDHITAFTELLVTRRLQAEARAGAPDPRAVNLVGFTSDPFTAELTALLGAAGVRVNVTLLPDLVPEDIDRLPEAGLHVMVRNSKWWDELYRQLLVDSRIGHVALDAPFGVRATRRWLEGVLEAVGLDPAAVGPVWDERFGAVAAEWDTLRRRAEGLSLGLVLRSEDLFLLEDPAHTLGIPLLAVAHELGFRTEILLRVAPESAADVTAKVLAHHPEPERATLVTFDTMEEMRERLAASASPAFLGNHTFDWRLSEAGKTRVPLRTFKMSLVGARTTLERLLAYCDVPYYRTYGRHLRRSGLGRLPARPIEEY